MATKKTTTKKTGTAKKTSTKEAGTGKPSTKRTASSKPAARKPSAKKPAATKSAATKKATAKTTNAKPSGLDLAAQVVADAGEPLGTKEIAKRVIAAGWTTKGKTPHATLYAAMSREITVKGSASRFAKSGRGLFKATGKAGR